MDSCPICDAPVSTERPRYQVVLEVEDTTRSTQFMEDETNVRRFSTEKQLCHDCWDDLRVKLS